VSQLPGGTVTFLFSDIEGSTRLLEQLGDGYEEVHRDHRRLLRAELEGAGGREVDTQGDAFFFSFVRAKDAVRGAVAAQRALATHRWPDGTDVRVRMGVHTGEPVVGDEGYVGMDVVRAARICSAGHGGQILVSETTRALVGNDLPDGVSIRDLGETRLKDVQHERLFQVTLSEQPGEHPPPKAAPTRTKADDLAREIESRVHEQILAGFDRRRDSSRKLVKLTLIGVLNLVLLAAAVVAIVLVVRALL
jgi:class 3 adenylate cyclase